MTKRFLLSLLFVATTGFAGADTLYLKDGEQALGVLKSMTADTVAFEGVDGIKELDKDDVSRIQLQRARLWDDVNEAAQVTDPDLRAALDTQPTEEQYPADGFAILLDRQTFDLTEPGVLKHTQRTIIKILRQRGEDVATFNVPYFEDTGKAEIDFALTVTPDGRVLHLSDMAIKDESLYGKVPGYRRLSRLRFAAKEPRPGSVIDVQRTVTRTLNTLLEPFYTEQTFRDRAPILRKEVRVVMPSIEEGTLAWCVSVPENGNSKCQTGTSGCLDNAPVKASRAVEGDNVVLAWSLTEPQSGIVDEPMMPPLQTFVPVLVVGDAVEWETLSSEYANKLAEVAPLSDELKTKALELGSAQAIHDYVARNVRAVPVPFRAYSLLPRSGNETAKRGLANELDKNFLYYQMLKAADIPCTFSLLRDRTHGPLCSKVASLSALQHCAVYLEKEKAFSEAATGVLAFGVLPGVFQGGEALPIAAGAKPVEVVETTLKDETETTEYNATLNVDGNLDIQIKLSAMGNQENAYRALKDLSDEEIRIQLQQLVSAIHPTAVLKDFTTTDLSDLSISPVLTVNCSVDGYAVKAGEDLMMFNVPGLEFSAAQVGRPERQHGLFWNQRGREIVTGTIQLPDGFELHSVPEKVNFKSSVADFAAQFKKEASNLAFTQTYDLKVSQAPADAYPEYKESQELRADLSRQRVILKKK